MRKTIALLLASGTLAAPAVALAAPPIRGHHHARTVARQQCMTERSTLGVNAFRLKYGPTGAFHKCVTARRPSDLQAAKQCRAERQQIGAPAFRAKYGGNPGLNRCIKALTGK